MSGDSLFTFESILPNKDWQEGRCDQQSKRAEKVKQTANNDPPIWNRPSRLLTVDGQALQIAIREAHVQFAVLDLLQKAGWPPNGVEVPNNFNGSLKDAIEALNYRLASTRLRILRRNNNTRISWDLFPR